MTKHKLTPWFPVGVKPIYIGEYEFRYESGYIFRSFFDGNNWIIHDKKYADMWGEKISNVGGDWRGIQK